MIRVKFTCGHVHGIDPDKAVPCPTCGERRIGRTLHAEPPRFTGVARGPRAIPMELQSIAVNLAAKDAEPLKLKPETVKES